jgi:hypothetical protein
MITEVGTDALNWARGSKKQGMFPDKTSRSNSYSLADVLNRLNSK